MLFLKRLNLLRMLQGQANFIQAVEQVMLAGWCNFKTERLSTWHCDGLRWQINIQRITFIGLALF